MEITKEYNIYCDVCGKYQPFSAYFESDWTDLQCEGCLVVIATIEKKSNAGDAHGDN